MSDTSTPKVRPHFHVLLDRSGSMAAMADDVIGGFNRLIADQQADGPDACITLVQFDSEDPQEVVLDAKRITKAVPLDRTTFVPRGGTPLLDATARLIARAADRQAARAAAGKPAEDVTFITITDGQENSSREVSRDDVRRLVEAKQAEGWTFVFMGAGLDAYGDARHMGYDDRSIQAFAPDGVGAQAAFTNLSARTVTYRRKLRGGETFDRQDYFEGDKPAEADRQRRYHR